MMTTEQLSKAVYDKMHAEQQAFRRELGLPGEPDWTSDDRNVDLEWTAEYFSRYQGNIINQNEE